MFGQEKSAYHDVFHLYLSNSSLDLSIQRTDELDKTLRSIEDSVELTLTVSDLFADMNNLILKSFIGFLFQNSTQFTKSSRKYANFLPSKV